MRPDRPSPAAAARIPARKTARRSIRRHLFFGLFVAIVLAGGVAGLAATTELSGAIIAQGQLVVDSSVKKVQHPVGGVVGDIRVRDGDHVNAGDILLSLDDTQTKASLEIIVKQMNELRARQARLEAETQGSAAIDFPADLIDQAATDDAVAALLAGERQLFTVRQTARDGEQGQLRQQVDQLQQQIAGLVDQQAATGQQIELADQELTGMRELWEHNLVSITQMTSLEQDSARLKGDQGQFEAEIAEAKGKIAETELKVIQVDSDMRAEDGKDLADIRSNLAELSQKRLAAEDDLRRIEIRAPEAGTVLELSVHTVGGVLGPGETAMLIVPNNDVLTVEAKIRPQDIDQVFVDQRAALRFTAFNQRSTPELVGDVSTISPDVVQDPKTGALYYTVRIAVPSSEVDRLKGLKLLPGMPVDAFMQTNPRTIVSYLMRPILDQVERAFKEN